MSDQIGSASIGLAVDSSGVDAGLNRMDASVERVGRSISSLGRSGAAAVDDLATSATRSASSVERGNQRQIRSLQTLRAELIAGGRDTRQFQEEMARNRGGEAAVAAIQPVLDQIEQLRAAQNASTQAALRNGQAFQNNAQSAAALAASLRSVPAQLTDIITSLQGGQQPLTVLLQQGGQLRDMFGSLGGAARALSGYIVSLITPLTAVAAAAAALAVAYNQGSKESDAFRLSIITTGNAAGVTTSQLAELAKQGSATAGTVGAQAEALAALVGTGRVGAEQLGKASTAAIQAQKFLGQAVEDTAKNFADLGKAPLQASLKLNESMNYLTEATYQQIKSLELQGRTTEAAKVAQAAYADTLGQRSKALEGSLGTLQKAWNGVGSAAKGAWDFMLNVGREDTIDDRIKKSEDALKAARLRQLGFIGTGAEKQQAVDEAQIALDRLRNMKKVQQVQAESDAAEKKRFDAARANEAEEEKYLTRREQQERAIARARQLVTDAAPRGQDPVVTEKAVQERIAQIRASYADLNNQGIESQIAAIDRLGAKQEEVAKRALITLQGNQDAGLNSSLDKQFEYIDKIAAADEAALTREKARLQERLRLTAQETVSEDGKAAQQQKLADLRGQIDLKDEQIATRRAQRDKDIFIADKKNTDAIAASYDALFDSRKADTNALEAQLQAQRDQNAALGLSGRALDDFNTKLVEEKAARLEAQAATIAGTEARQDEAEELRRQAQLLRDINKAQIEGANKAKAIEANKTFWESVDKTAQAAFTAIFEGGKSVSDRLRDAFKAGILDILYQLTVKKWIINISTSLSGQSLAGNIGSLLGVPGASAGTTASGASSLSTAASLANIGKSVYDAVSAGFTGLATSLGTGVGALGNLIGSSSLSGFGTGLASGGYSAAGQAYLAQNVPGAAAGLSTAPLITAAAGIAAGVLGGKLVSGGYSAFGGSGNSAVNTGTAVGAVVGSIVPVIGTAIGALVGGLIGGATNRLFGYKSPQIESQGIQGTITSGGVDASTYANILQKGGLFRSDKRYTNTAAVTGDTDAGFDKTIQAIVAAVKGFGTAIGEESTRIDSFVKDFKLQLTGEAAKDQELITKLFSDTGDELANLLVPNLSKLTREGETASAALQRVATDYVALNAALSAIGLQFGAVGAASLDSREALIALTGGIDNFVSQAEFFSQNFLSEAERTAAVRKQLDQAFADLGVTAIPKTRDEFKALVQGLNLTTEGGQKTYAGLMNLQQAFASVTPQVDAAAEAAKAAAEAQAAAAEAAAKALSQQKEQRALDIALMQALGNEEQALAATRADALAALLTDQARITQAQIYAAQDAKKVYDSLVGVADNALSRLSTSINAEKDRINAAYSAQAESVRNATAESVKNAQASLKAAQDQASAIQTVFSALDGALGSAQIESDTATEARRRAAQDALLVALKNPSGLASNTDLTKTLGIITSTSNDRLFGTFEEYARDQARTNNAIVALRGAAGEQVDNAALTVKRLESTIDAIQLAGDKQLAQLASDNQSQLQKLDLQLANQAAQIDALKGIDNSVLSVKSALDGVSAAIAALRSSPTGQTNSTDVYTAQIKELYTSILGREGKQEGINFWVNALKSGVSLDHIRQEFLDSPEYQRLLASINNIPPITQGQVQALMARASDPVANSAVLADVVKQQAVAMANMQAALDRIAASSETSADVLDRAQKGQPLATEAV